MLGELHSVLGRYDVRIDPKVMADPANLERYEFYRSSAVRHGMKPFTYLDDLMDRAFWSGDDSLWSVSLTDGAHRWTGTVSAPSARNALFQSSEEFWSAYHAEPDSGTITLTCL